MYIDKNMSSPAEFRNFWHTLLPELSSSDLDTIDALYPDPSTEDASPYVETRLNHGLEAQYKRSEAVYGHYAYVGPVRQTAQFASSEGISVYLYHWALARTVVGRANHGDNMFYETYSKGTTDLSGSQKELSGTLHAYLTSFITAGDPNEIKGRYAKRPEYFTPDDPGVLVLGQGNEELIVGVTAPAANFVADDWAREQTKFWWSKVEISQLA
jgi:carboxylesterase type B